MASPAQDDLTPISGSATDVAPLGRSGPVPAHERTDLGTGDVPWTAISEMPEFKELIRAKLRFIVPATVFFMVYYLLLQILVGYFPEMMKQEVLGRANIAYLFGLSQFFMAWILAAIYVKVAAGWDRRAAGILAALPKH